MLLIVGRIMLVRASTWSLSFPLLGEEPIPMHQRGMGLERSVHPHCS